MIQSRLAENALYFQYSNTVYCTKLYKKQNQKYAGESKIQSTIRF